MGTTFKKRLRLTSNRVVLVLGRAVETKLVLHIERLQAAEFVLSRKTVKKICILK
jgi:hypothetical protein